VDSRDNSFQYTPEYYAVKHNSHFVPSGSVVLATSDPNALAFRNPDNQIILIIDNQSADDIQKTIKVGQSVFTATIQSQSFSTFVIDDQSAILNLMTNEINSSDAVNIPGITPAVKALNGTEESIEKINTTLSDYYEAEKAKIQLNNVNIRAKELLGAFEENTEQLREQSALSDVIIADKKSVTDLILDQTSVLNQAMIDFQKSISTTPDQPLNVTALIKNPSFHSGDKHESISGSSEYWTIDNEQSGGDFRLNFLGGKNCWNNWSNNFKSMNVYQDLENLAPGMYQVKALAMTNQGNLNDQHLYAQSGESKVVSSEMTIDQYFNDIKGWEALETPKIEVGEDGILRIGFESTSGGDSKGWFCVTDFELIYSGN